MDPVLIVVVLVFGLLTAGAVAGIVLQLRASGKRMEALLQLAPRLELTPVQPEALVRGQHAGEADVWDAAGAAFGLAPTNRGQVANLFHGQREGRDVWLFDFSYSRIPGPHSTSLRTTVVSLALRATLPQFRLSPPGTVDVLRAEDEAAVRGLLSPAVLESLTGSSTLTVASVGHRLVCHGTPAADGRTPLADVPSLLDHAVETARQLRA